MSDETKEIFQKEPDEVYGSYGGSIGFFNYLAGAGETVPPWWSIARDNRLRQFSKDSDHLSGTVNTLRDMLVAIPFKVLPRNPSIRAHIAQAAKWSAFLLEDTESRNNFTGSGWGVGYGAFVEDYHVQDNGAFFVIEGKGNADGPLLGMPTKLIHLDSGRVWRTHSREFPIIYTDWDGKRYKIHRTRIINLTSMSSPIADMYGVGFCAVSRCINVVQNLIDIGRYKQEKLGSRPMRALLHIAGGGQREAKTLSNLLLQYNAMLDNEGFTRYGKIPIFGSGGELTLIDFASLPDGFNELESTQLAMSVLALAFGVDVRQLAFALGVAGQTRADAEVQHLKMRGKGPGLFIQEFERQINTKLLPPYLHIVFDYQDDEADRNSAEIRKTRATARKLDLESGVTDLATERQLMLASGEISREQFEALEQPEEVQETSEIVEDDDENKAKNFTPPKAAQNNAKRVLKWRSKYSDEIQGMTRVGWIRANQLASGQPVSLDTVKRMAQFNRHRQNAEIAEEHRSTPWKDAGYVAWLGWGGTEGVDWAIRISEDEKKSLSSFTASIRAATRGLRTGQIDLFDFINAMNAAIQRGYNQAWNEGALKCGIRPDERTPEEQATLGQMIATAQGAVYGLGEWIIESEPTPTQINSRLQMWSGDYTLVQTTGQNMACGNQKAEWILGATEEHCKSCSGFNGRVYRRSTWEANNATPRSRELECNGYRCECKLVDTDKRITPGRFPRRLIQ